MKLTEIAEISKNSLKKQNFIFIKNTYSKH